MQVAKPKKGYKLAKWYFGKHLEIPEGWEYLKFNEVVKTNPSTKIEDKTVPYIPMDSVDTKKPSFNYTEERLLSENNSLNKFQDNDVLFARITPSTENGKTSFVENFRKKGIVSSELTVLRPSERVFPKYLYYYIKSDMIRQFAISQMMGTTGRQRVPDSVFKEVLHFALPPLPEQNQIAYILSNVDDTLQKTNQIIEQTQRLKTGMMHKLLTRGIGHTKFKEVSLIPNYIRIKIPDSWKVISLGEIAKLQGGFAFKSEEYTENGIQLLKIANVSHSEFLWNEQSFVPNSFWEKHPEFRLNKNDIIIALTRPIISSGLKIGILDSNVKCLLNQRVGRFIVKPNMDLKYLFYFLNLQYIINQIKFRTAENLQPNISTDEFEKILIWIPNNLPEQKQISSILSNVDIQIQKEKLHKSNLERLKKGLMQKLLTGQIRVKIK